jgi:DNA invertase Pin-like site-specific DNA recombinase
MSEKAILYARSATGENDALQRQLKLCREWASANGYSVAGEYAEIASGVAPVLPAQVKAIAQAQADGAALICLEASRIARDSKLYLEHMQACERQGVQVLFANGEAPVR